MSERPSSTPPSEYFFERFPWNNKWILFGVALGLSFFDFLAGPIVFFPVMFVVPVALLGWNCGLRTAFRMGAVLCLIRFCIQCAWGIPYTMPVAVINGVVRVCLLFFITFLCAKLSEQTQLLRARIRTLEGILPTCSFCKDIRDEEGNWHQIESFVASRSEARFSHGVCPTCAAKHYGDIVNKKKKAEVVVGSVTGRQ
jgi:hypothetical protein